jgi:DNA polymerase I-like protein with 3'-5' exonuclease and polymerase domains
LGGFFDLSNIPDVIEHKVNTSHSCATCKMFEKCQTPKIAPYGEGKLSIMVIGGSVSLAAENSNNRKQGSHYLYLKKRLKAVGIDLYSDCWYINAIRCYKDDDKYGAKALSGCGTLLQGDIRDYKPKVILVTDELGWNVLTSTRMANTRASGSLWDYAGSIIPDQELKTWILPIIPTHFLIEMENEIDRKRKEYGEHYKGNNRFEPFYTQQLLAIGETINKPVPLYTYESKCSIAKDATQAIEFMKLANQWACYAFDYETTGLAWHNPQQQIHSVSFSNGHISYAMMWYKDNKEFMNAVQTLLTNKAAKIAYNKGFERSWSIGRAFVEPTNLIHDPMLMAHVWRNLSPTSLKFCLYREYGIMGYDGDIDHYLKPSKEDERKYGKNALNRIMDAPTDKVLQYVALDSLFTYWLAKFYLEKMDKQHMMPGYKLLARAERPLTHMHLNGLRVDLEGIAKWKPILQDRIDEQYKIIMDSDLIHYKWHGANRFKPSSDADIRILLFNILKLKPISFTDSGLPSVDADALEEYRHAFPLAENILEYRRWYKLLNTFIAQLEREQWDGIIHSYFSLNNVDSFRSGSQRVNLTNQPKHDKDVMNIIRSFFMPRKGHKLTSTDYAQLEIRANAGITRDKNLIKAVTGGLDMHTAMSIKLFMLSDEQKNKKCRNVSKTQVFRLWYGGSGEQMAEGTWKIINSHSAIEQLGMDMKAHLRSKGITTYEQWKEHCIKTEKWLWNDLFPDYQAWRKETYTGYLTNGYLHYPNGFTYQGIASRNALLNGPGQGAGFHVNLWAIVHIFEELEERKMDTKLVVEIHDDVMGDVAPNEEELYKEIIYKHMVAKAHDYSPWMKGIPLEVEYGCAEVDRPWSEIKEVGVLTTPTA